jgi:hypothetical protein
MKIALAVLLICTGLFSCNKKDSSKLSGNVNQLISRQPTSGFENEKAFIIQAVDNSYNFIEMAEIAQLKGSQLTCSQATALKDGQVAILYHLIDYADIKLIELPETNASNEAIRLLYQDPPDFDKRWHTEVAKQNEEMIKNFETFKSLDKNLNKMIADVLNTLRFNRTVLDDYIAESN